MGGKRVSPELRSLILEGVGQGLLLIDVARETGVSLDTVRRIVDADRKAKASPAKAAPKPAARPSEAPPQASALAASLSARAASDPEPADVAAADAADDAELPELDDNDLLASARALYRWMLREAQRMQRLGNARGATTTINSAAKTLMPMLARLEKIQQEQSSVIRVSREEVERGMALMRERFAAILDRPLHCAECSRRLSATIGLGPDVDLVELENKGR